MGRQKECTEEDRASHWLLQAEGRKQDSRARAELLERERQRVRADGGEKLPHARLPTPAHGARGKGLAEGSQNDQRVSVPGQGLHSDRAKMIAAVNRRGLAALAWKPVHKCGRLGSEITGGNLSCGCAGHLHVCLAIDSVLLWACRTRAESRPTPALRVGRPRTFL